MIFGMRDNTHFSPADVFLRIASYVLSLNTRDTAVVFKAIHVHLEKLIQNKINQNYINIVNFLEKEAKKKKEKPESVQKSLDILAEQNADELARNKLRAKIRFSFQNQALKNKDDPTLPRLRKSSLISS